MNLRNIKSILSMLKYAILSRGKSSEQPKMSRAERIEKYYRENRYSPRANYLWLSTETVIQLSL